MKPNAQAERQQKSEGRETLFIRFPLPASSEGTQRRPKRRLSRLLPRRWRRQVVIQGQRFWLPG